MLAPVVRPVPPGTDSLAAWSTEVVHYLPGAARTRSSVRADVVLRAPEAGLPVLLVEVDRCTGADEVLAAKLARSHQFFRLRTKDVSGRAVLVRRSLYPPAGREGHPPIAVVFGPGTRMGGTGAEEPDENRHEPDLHELLGPVRGLGQ